MRVVFLLWAGLSAALAHAATEPSGALTLSAEQQRQMGVATRQLSEMKANGEHVLPAQVVIDPRQLEVLAAPLAGIVTRVGALSGETVKKGQVLGELRGAQLLELQRDFLAARAQAETAAESLRRDEALLGDGIIPQSRLSQTRLQHSQAVAQLAEKRQSLRLAGLGEPGQGAANFNGSVTLRAPFDGVVLESAIQPGQRVDSNALLFKLGRLAPLGLEMQAPPAVAAGMRKGDVITIAGCANQGRVTVVAPSLTGISQSVLVRGELAKPAGCVQPYQQLQARVQSSADTATPHGWVIPREAVVRHQGQTWVFVADGKGYRPVAVKLAEEYEQALSIETDLPPRSALVVKGAMALKALWLGLGGGSN